MAFCLHGCFCLLCLSQVVAVDNASSSCVCDSGWSGVNDIVLSAGHDCNTNIVAVTVLYSIALVYGFVKLISTHIHRHTPTHTYTFIDLRSPMVHCFSEHTVCSFTSILRSSSQLAIARSRAQRNTEPVTFSKNSNDAKLVVISTSRLAIVAPAPQQYQPMHVHVPLSPVHLNEPKPSLVNIEHPVPGTIARTVRCTELLSWWSATSSASVVHEHAIKTPAFILVNNTCIAVFNAHSAFAFSASNSP